MKQLSLNSIVPNSSFKINLIKPVKETSNENYHTSDNIVTTEEHKVPLQEINSTYSGGLNHEDSSYNTPIRSKSKRGNQQMFADNIESNQFNYNLTMEPRDRFQSFSSLRNDQFVGKSHGNNQVENRFTHFSMTGNILRPSMDAVQIEKLSQHINKDDPPSNMDYFSNANRMKNWKSSNSLFSNLNDKQHNNPTNHLPTQNHRQSIESNFFFPFLNIENKEGKGPLDSNNQTMILESGVAPPEIL